MSGLGPAHDALCARLLKKAAADRFQSAEEALGAIHALTDTEKIASSHSRTRAARVAHAGWRLVWARRPVLLVVAASVTLALVSSAWWYSRGVSLPVSPPDARGHYARGVMALRDGTYAGARDQFQLALRLFPYYVEALSGLTLASKELDDTERATQAMMRVNRLVPDHRLDAAWVPYSFPGEAPIECELLGGASGRL